MLIVYILMSRMHEFQIAKTLSDITITLYSGNSFA